MPANPKVVGIGGVFFRSADPKKVHKWYARHFGFEILYDKCAVFSWESESRSPRVRQTVWAPFARETDYFGPRRNQFMVNFIVDDLDGMLRKLRKARVKISKEPIDESYGRFAWVYDPEGRKIELWEPPPKPRKKRGA